MNEISNVFGQSTELIGDRLATWATVLVSNIPNLIVAGRSFICICLHRQTQCSHCEIPHGKIKV